MLVESYDEEGGKVYEMIIKQIFQDLQLSPSVKDLRAFVNPDEVVFIIAILINKTSSTLHLSDVAEVKYSRDTDETTIGVGNENYLPNILKKLWIEKGRENVHQPNRYAIIVKGQDKNLANLIIDDPHLNLQKKVYDAIYRIIPEGFKIVKDISEEDIIAVVATDELIKDAWLEKGQSYIQELREADKPFYS